MKIHSALSLVAVLALSASAFAQKPSPAPMKKGDKMAMSGKMGKVKMHKACAHCAKAGKKMCSCPVDAKGKMAGKSSKMPGKM